MTIVVAVAFVGGFVLGGKDSSEGPGGLRVNGAEVVRNVWEARLEAADQQPPFCHPQTQDGIGHWRCTLNATRAQEQQGNFGPSLIDISVGEDGSIRFEDEKEPRACCIEVDGVEARSQR